MINWPTAFVIAIAMICGAFLINKPSDAAFGGSEGMILRVGDGGGIWHLKDGKVRNCLLSRPEEGAPTCGAWTD
jgi:hypothetical protein